ncbi:MAG: oligosaccharide flippase family protein [Acutalibacteraceae bacterium]|nr:oligosaccharide flippase family protein [Acutalibacteraceae bacterium]
MKKTLFIKNAVILTVTGTLLRFLGIIFKVWLAGAVGSEGIGLYHIVFSLYTLAATFASSGITVAVTRLCADEQAVGSKRGLHLIIRKATVTALTVATLTFIILILGANFISAKLLSDSRASLSVCVFAFSLPFMAVSSVVKGYFAARRQVWANSAAVLLEQIVRIVFCFAFVKKLSVYGIGGAVAGVMAGDTLAEIISCVFIFILYNSDIKRVAGTGESSNFSRYSQLLRIAAPITAGRYAVSLLRTVENILVPKTLTKAGGDYSASLSIFGALKGMALPVLFFPSSLLNAFSSLLIPEMSEALIKKQPRIIKSSVSKALKTTWLMGVIFACIFFFCGKKIGAFIYSDSDSGFLIHILAPLVPLMYLDSISDGILKGLDRQVFTFRTAVIDSALRVLFILIFVPRYSINGFIVIMFASNIFTSLLNVGKLLSVTGIKPRLITTVLLPILSAAGITMLFCSLFSFISNTLIYLAAVSVFSVVLYAAFVIGFGLWEK